MKPHALAALLAAGLTAGPVPASDFNVRIGRDLSTSGKVGVVTTAAVGRGAQALANVAGAQGRRSDIRTGRDFSASARAGSVTAAAIGRGTAAVNLAGVQVQNGGARFGRDFRSSVATGSVASVTAGSFGTGPVNLGGVQSLR